MNQRLILLVFVLSTAVFSAAPVQAQTRAGLTGSVLDAAGLSPLPGATVQVMLADTSIGTTTDASGVFRFAELPTGIHRVVASYVGYGSTEISEVWVRSGKEETIEFRLSRSMNELREVVVRPSTPERMDPMSAHMLTVEQSLRYPATFFDPARLAMSYAGVASTNDQANHFSVRGNGPASNAWLLEGAEIVNPNHLTNAGTASDLPTLSGGGATILSAQMLGTSRVLLGGFTAQYGNALGGLMDLRLRPGTNARHAFTAQAGLIGLDFSAEGPFKNGGKASYLVNYRYSTLGLLSAMGVALGDEAITFQDLAFTVNLPMGQRSTLMLFGMGGNSSNNFAAKDTADWEFDKDSQTIDYTAMVGAAGASFKHRFGERTLWNTTFVISDNEQDRVESGPFGIRRGTATVTNGLNERKLSMVSAVRGSFGARTNYQLGGSVMQRITRKALTYKEDIIAWLVRPYAEVSYDITERLRTEIGVAYASNVVDGSYVLEPRLALILRTGKGRTLKLHVGQRGQLPNVQLYPVQVGSVDNRSIGMSRSQEAVLAYDHPIGQYLVLHGELYVQRQDRVPIGVRDPFSTRPLATASLVNGWDDYYNLQLDQMGEAMNTGLELSLSRDFRNGLFFQVNGSLIDATYTDKDGATYDSRWNTSAMGNVVVGREFVKQKPSAKHTWGVNGRVNATGGQRYTAIATMPLENVDPYGSQYATTYRVDLRVYLKRERKAHTGLWSLDLLNVTNAQNEAYKYYDTRKGEVVTKYQLGLIPNLSYRIEF